MQIEKQITRDETKEYFNTMELGSIVSTKTIPNVINPSTVGWLLKDLNRSGDIKRVGIGKYKLTKKIPLKTKGGCRGKKRGQGTKDMSMIPTILKYDTNGLVISEIRRIYKNLTPEDQQVGAAYTRNLFAFAKHEGIIIKNGYDKRFKREGCGLPPSRYKLVDPDISNIEWEAFLVKFRMYSQERNKNKNKKRATKAKTIKEKFSCCGTIIDHFQETRDNPNKIHSETFFINKVRERLGDKLVKCFAITGPDYFHHMDSLFTTISNKTLVCEIAPDVFGSIYKKAQICQYFINKKVALLNCDVNDIAPVDCRYTDIDLMCTIKTNYDIISNQLMRQDLLCDIKQEKYFTFTCTRRTQESFEIAVSYLRKLLKEHLDADLLSISDGEEVRSDQKQLSSCKQCQPHFNDKGRIIDFHLFKYQDKTPMFNALIVYK